MYHVTYFGTNIEYIQGIHMLPLLPFSTLTRTKTFVTQEWNTYFAPNNYAAGVEGGWRGILYANYAIIQATASYAFFSNATFDYSLLDGGASRTWYLTWSAALGGSTASAKREVSTSSSLTARAASVVAGAEDLVPRGLREMKSALRKVFKKINDSTN